MDLFEPALDVVAAIIHAMHTAKRVFGQAELKPRLVADLVARAYAYLQIGCVAP